jgi:mRNA interferase RelE/StbE
MDYTFTSVGLRTLKKLPKDVQVRIITKLDFFVEQENPLQFAEYLINSDIGSYRFRIGDYRVIFDVDENEIVVLAVGHRREIYR